MPRDGSGILSAPAGTTATSGTTIESAKYNAFVNDWVTDGNTARPIVAGGTGATTAGAARTALGIDIGTNVQAYDAGLTSIAGLTTAADRMIYTTASDVYAVATLTAAGRAILDDADAAAQRTTLGLGALATAANITTAEIAAATLVTAADTIASNNNDTTVPTSAAVKAYADSLSSPVKAWVNFNGTGTPAIRGSFNVSSITDNGTGDYTINFTNALADANYAVVITAGGTSTAVNNSAVGWAAVYAAGSVRIAISDNNADTNIDFPNVNVVVFR